VPSAIASYRQILRKQLPALVSKYHVAALGLFGSRVRGEEREDSDLDILVSFDETPTLFQFIDLECELSDVLGLKVDLVMRESLKPDVSQRVLQEVIPV